MRRRGSGAGLAHLFDRLLDAAIAAPHRHESPPPLLGLHPVPPGGGASPRFLPHAGSMAPQCRGVAGYNKKSRDSRTLRALAETGGRKRGVGVVANAVTDQRRSTSGQYSN